MIPQHIARMFPAEIRSRGSRYFSERRVKLDQAEPPLIRARVRGTLNYGVTIKMTPSRWSMSCDCPYAFDAGNCKHLWAVLLAADNSGLFLDHADGQPDNGVRAARKETAPARKEPTPAWKRRLSAVRRSAEQDIETGKAADWPADRVIAYRIDLDSLHATGQITVEVRAERLPGLRGTGSFSFTNDHWLNAPDASDQHIAHMLLGAKPELSYLSHTYEQRRFVIPPSMYDTTLRMICQTGRCRATARSTGMPDSAPMDWDAGAPWKLRLQVAPERAGRWQLAGVLHRDNEELPLADLLVLTANGLLIRPNAVARLETDGMWPIIQMLRTGEPIVVPNHQLFDLIAELHLLPNAPTIALPAGLTLEEAWPTPQPHLVVKPSAEGRSMPEHLEAQLSFDYDGNLVSRSKSGRAIVQKDRHRLVHRQPETERLALERLLALGFRWQHNWRSDSRHLVIAPRHLQLVVEVLTAEGWHVEADGKRFRLAGETQVNVSSGIDWFELNGTVEFGDQRAALPQLLAALRRGERTVVLDDGTHGILPVQWLQRYAGIMGFGTESEDGTAIRFTRAQTALLDALLATLPEPQVDATFDRVRNELRSFDSVQPIDPPEGFTGSLRNYQREGVGWMAFLRRFGLGGCLADDMGLGKTIQVLALLEERRAAGAGPTLVIVPKSLVFNWQQEAARFTPALRIRDYTGSQRRKEQLDPAAFDLLLTTYGTLRRDAPELKEIEFEYIILDEAQAIKNANTASAKAARLLRARNRLALSGTPVENRLDDLWSIFEFLNPGMLGASNAFSAVRRDGLDDEVNGRTLLAKALRPFILRRTKEQVAPELPPRIEQTLVVELEPAQRALYDELRDHYRRALLQRVDSIGIKRARIEILEALLRLRQAACHPALIDARHAAQGSAKLNVLLNQLSEIVAEGHKALVFSQFTSLLALVRDQLEAAGITYEYLDGRTRNREARVQRFQSDAECPVFLISLRAGGYGLNLTAADYVFLLDPWWNPAVEAQAIDRTHRIGQQRHVFAMRLIARDTVEEKVLELQQHKRNLADAILGADAGALAAIGREELELLLG